MEDAATGRTGDLLSRRRYRQDHNSSWPYNRSHQGRLGLRADYETRNKAGRMPLARQRTLFMRPVLVSSDGCAHCHIRPYRPRYLKGAGFGP
jgi:hypothetical protein